MLTNEPSVYDVYYTETDDATNDNPMIQRERYLSLERTPEQIVNRYTNEHPNRRIIGFFNIKSNLFDEDSRRHETFSKYCSLFGFCDNDFNALVCCAGKTYRFIGFLPQNTKYKALLQNEITGTFTKATLQYVKKYMATNTN